MNLMNTDNNSQIILLTWYPEGKVRDMLTFTTTEDLTKYFARYGVSSNSRKLFIASFDSEPQNWIPVTYEKLMETEKQTVISDLQKQLDQVHTELVSMARRVQDLEKSIDRLRIWKTK